jgi:V-type H+-transporting ATPase subunit a
MFGDIGHGLLLFIGASYLCLKSESLKSNPSMYIFLKIRYLLLLMGFYATFCGLIYNDMMAMPLNLFGSCYTNFTDKSAHQNDECVYPFGIDPKWYIAKNELQFMNSLKMKIAVILGVG